MILYILLINGKIAGIEKNLPKLYERMEGIKKDLLIETEDLPPYPTMYRQINRKSYWAWESNIQCFEIQVFFHPSLKEWVTE